MAKPYIGTSGYMYFHWRGDFYPKDLPITDWLSFYSQNFNTVEINASFYHSMKKSTYRNWAQKVPEDFIFAIKGSRFITHIKRLKNCQEPLENLLEETSGLEEKLGVILFQLPPRFKANQKLLEEFLEDLKKATINHELSTMNRYAFEFRDESWLNGEILQTLKKYGAALCIQDSPNWPKELTVTAPFVYLRFHGGKILYTSSYSKSELEGWAKKIKSWLKDGLDVYAYFNNDALGFAIKNAQTLAKMIEK